MTRYALRRLVPVLISLLCVCGLPAAAQAATCTAAAEPGCSISARSVPAFKGWGTVSGTTNAAAWAWVNGAWSARTLNAGERVYVWPWGSGWTWAWTQRTGWIAAPTARLQVAVSDIFASSATYRFPYAEIGEPTGTHAGKAPRGVMLVIHGGGLYGDNPNAARERRPLADRWRARGWLTVNIDYRTGVPALTDVPAFYDRISQVSGAGAKICATGESAGGYLSLMLAEKRPALSCAIVLAGASDLSTVPLLVRLTIAVASLSNEQLHAMSPIAGAHTIRARVIWGVGSNDPTTPPDQMYAMQRVLPAMTGTVLKAPGPIGFVHTYIAQSEWDRWLALEQTFSESVLA